MKNSGEEGKLRDCDFYISDRDDRSGMAFCVASEAAKESKNNDELCAAVGSMICAVAVGLRIPVDLALNGIGLRPREVRLPSEASKYQIKVPEKMMDWRSIVVNFGCCILVLLKNDYDNEADYNAYISDCIRQMQRKVGYDSDDPDLDAPFDFERAKSIRSMLGGLNSSLRDSVLKHMVGNLNSVNDNFHHVVHVYHFLFYLLYWAADDEFNAINERLVKPQSGVLDDPCLSEEVENLAEVSEIVKSHRDLVMGTRGLIRMTSEAKLVSAVDYLRFPTLFARAQELDKGGDDGSTAVTSIAEGRVKLKTIQDLLKLYREGLWAPP